MPHIVVLVAPTAGTVRRLDDLAGDQAYYFPVRAAKGKKTKNLYADPGFVNHALQFMPGVDMSCHAWRRGFASHGQRALGLSLQEIKLILDHSEGAPPGDVTAGNYALDPLLQKKKEIMTSWSDWLETQVRAAIDADHTLLDREALSQAIYRARYGETRWLRRISQGSKLPEAAE
jgi:integrase